VQGSDRQKLRKGFGAVATAGMGVAPGEAGSGGQVVVNGGARTLSGVGLGVVVAVVLAGWVGVVNMRGASEDGESK